MTKVALKVPHRSGFDKSHQNILTGKCGTLIPILCDELIPNTKVHLADIISASLPPLASDTFMRCNLKVEAFFVPSRLLYGGFVDWLTQNTIRDHTATNFTVETPCLQLTSSTIGVYCNPGSLSDYLGLRSVNITSGSVNRNINIYPFLAYHRIYDDWYRNTNIQAPCFVPAIYHGSYSNQLYHIPFVTYNQLQTWTLSSPLADGVALGSLRQRNFGFDYFTNAFASAQLGSANRVSIATSTNPTYMTIASLRAANSLQQFSERNQMAGHRLQDYVNANYGADLSTGVAQRAILLGSGEIPVYSKGIYQTTPFDNNGGSHTENPFEGSPGAEFGSAQCSGKLNLVDDFTAQEPGYLMVLASLVPVVTYSNGLDKMFMRYNASGSQTDMANPLLQNTGNEPIYQFELTGDLDNPTSVFGYGDRYASYKQKFDTLHGLLRDGQSLDVFALQRSVSGNPQINSNFLEIPTSYLDQVAAVSGTISQYGIWLDCFHDYKVSMPLAAYSIPSLQDPSYEHGQDVFVQVNGSSL